MDELFGIKNRVETLIWKKSYGGGTKSKHVVNLHEYVLCYARNKDLVPRLFLPPDKAILKYYKFRDDKYEKMGPYRLQPLSTNSMDERENLRYAIPYDGEEVWPEKQWQWEKSRALAALADNSLVVTPNKQKKAKTKWTVNYKQYLYGEDGEERGRKLYSVIDKIYTQQGTAEIEAIFGDGKAFPFPKPSTLIKEFVQLCTGDGDIILDSFAGSGTTGHAVLRANAEDQKKRQFLLVEMDHDIAEKITSERLKRVIQGYGAQAGIEGTFQYCILGPEMFDASGKITEHVRFNDLARHLFFVETRTALPKKKVDSPLIGTFAGTGYYLLFNGVLGDLRPEGGNVLTTKLLDALPPHDGPRVIYGESCRLSESRLQRQGILFKQIPYQIRTS